MLAMQPLIDEAMSDEEIGRRLRVAGIVVVPPPHDQRGAKMNNEHAEPLCR